MIIQYCNGTQVPHTLTNLVNRARATHKSIETIAY